MVQFNTTIEDFSPLILYSPQWRAGSSSTDSLADLYSDSSFTLTQSDGATATFIFNGTAFTIFGAKRGNHGFYQVTVDGNLFPLVDGAAPDPGQFQVPLFSSPLLSQGEHTVTLTNQGNTFVDIDFITYENNMGEDNDQLSVTTVQDTDAAFVYTPGNLWGTNVPDEGTYSGSSGHGTASPGAFLTYTFTGEGVSLYGPVGPANSPFIVTLDGGTPVNHTANKQFYQPQVLLYSAMNLEAGEHVVKVEYEPSVSGQIFAIDYANIYTSGTTPSSLKAANTSTSHGLPSAAVAGIVIAVLFILLILSALALFLRGRKYRKNNTSLENPMVQSRETAPSVTYPAPSRWYPTRNSVTDGSEYSSENLIVNTQYVASAPSEAEESPTSHYGASRAVPHAGTLPTPVKGRAPALPPTAYQSLAHLPTSDLRANRRFVPGRQQDFGPAPPDYVQATERYGGT